jgi:hypothetical protein
MIIESIVCSVSLNVLIIRASTGANFIDADGSD